MSKIPQIVISGSIAIDRIMNFGGSYQEVINPEKLHVLSLSILINDLKSSRGGVGANIAYSLALLGEKPILMGSVGDDAKEYMEFLKGVGVNTDYIHWSAKHTASFNVISDINGNQIGGFYPGAMFDSDSTSFTKLNDGSAFYVVSPDDPKLMRRLCVECIDHKLRLFYDVGQQISNISADDIRIGVNAAELLIVNDYELGVLLNKLEITKTDLLSQVKVLVTTLGEKGCIVESTAMKVNEQVPALKVENAVDPTGAGDAFRGGFLYGYVRDWDMIKCAKLGAVTGAAAVNQFGTQEHTFTQAIINEIVDE